MRICEAGEILATETVTALASRIEGIRFIEGRSATLKGIQRPMRYAAVEPEAPLPPLPRLETLRGMPANDAGTSPPLPH